MKLQNEGKVHNEERAMHTWSGCWEKQAEVYKSKLDIRGRLSKGTHLTEIYIYAMHKMHLKVGVSKLHNKTVTKSDLPWYGG